MSHRPHGYTLVELLVVIALVGLLAGLAVPSFRSLMASRQLQSQASSFAASLRLARAEAVRRAAPVSVCQRQSGADACEADASRRDWAAGWIVFVDWNADGRIDAPGDRVVRIQPEAPDAGSALAGGATRYFITYRPSGIAVGAANSLRFAPPSGSTATPRLACINFSGGVRLVAATAC